MEEFEKLQLSCNTKEECGKENLEDVLKGVYNKVRFSTRGY